MNIRDFLNSISPIPDTEIRKAMPLFYPRNLKPKEFMIRIGDTPDEIAIVQKGMLRTMYADEEGNEYVKGFVKEGNFVGPYVALLCGEKSNINVEAIEESALICLKYSHLLQLYETHPSWLVMGRKVAEQLLIQREKRAVELLILSARQRYELFMKEFPDLGERVPQWQIASYIGITTVALSRIRKQMKST